MDVSAVGRQAGVAGSERTMMIQPRRRNLVAVNQRKSASLFPVSRLPCRISAARAVVRAEAVKKLAGRKDSSRKFTADRPQLFVGLPADAVSDCNAVNHSKAISAGLKALKLLGVDGVELPIWWGIVEKESMGKYDWSGYLSLVQMIQDSGLLVRISLYTHASSDPSIPLPEWISAIGSSDPSIFFTDRLGNLNKDCLSFSSDDLPVLNGKTPLQVYGSLLQSFKDSFSPFLGSTITDILIGLGPDGELKYPSKDRKMTGAGEFQCYDKNMLSDLKLHAESSGNPFWGLSGPHDAPSYNQSPISSAFFRDSNGSWETPYGDFFLSWYSSHLLSHADRVLSLSSALLADLPLQLHGKLPVLHSWYNSRSHPSELVAGFYNTVNRDGYDSIAEIFSKNSCGMILPAMDLSDEHRTPESLIAQIMTACGRYGVEVSGENSSLTNGAKGLEKIKDTLLRGEMKAGKFTYQRMGAYFFSPEHFPAFTQFVRSLERSELQADDLPEADGERISLKVGTSKREMQTA